MLVLSIKTITNSKPVKWTGQNLSDIKPGQIFSRFSGDHPDNPEYGTVEIKTKVISGNFDGIEEMIFIAGDPMSATLVSHKKHLFGGYTIEVDFNTIFAHGLEYSVRNLIPQGGGIIGLSATDKASLKEIGGQKQLLSLLARLIMPGKEKQIEALALPSLMLIPNDNSDKAKSHFTGAPKLEEGTIIPHSNESQSLLHLATFHTDELPDIIKAQLPRKHLSFYIKTQETENGWPEKGDTFRVLHYDRIVQSESPESGETEPETNFDTRLLLDLPKYDHSVLTQLRWSSDEMTQYEAMASVYKNLLLSDLSDKEVNKLFGYPDNVQGCVAYEAERIKNNREYSDDIYEDAVNWRLLLQVSPYCKWFKFFDEFGDGAIYFMIKQNDLQAGNFDDVQVVVQST